MTREEQIIKASQIYAKALQKPFLDGAMWADKRPTTEWIDKACEWLEDKLPLYWGQVNADNTDRFVRLFKKYMEEQ